MVILRSEKDSSVKFQPQQKRLRFPPFIRVEVKRGCAYGVECNGNRMVLGDVPAGARLVTFDKYEVEFKLKTKKK